MRHYAFPLFLILFACSPNSEPAEADSMTEASTDVVDNTQENPEIDEVEIIESENNGSEAVDYTSNEYDDIDWQEYEASMTQDFSFVILISTKSYDAALERANDASEKLGYPLDLRDLHPHDETGLSLPKDVCEGICGGGMVEYPQYLPRNDWGDSKYVSVEYSNGFDGFTPGYYIVIVASGEKGDPIIEEALEESRTYYEDAYAKTCGVWMGCGC